MLTLRTHTHHPGHPPAKSLVWERTEGGVLFAGGAKSDDAKQVWSTYICADSERGMDSLSHTHTRTQGAIGDCWFLGALSLIATRDDLLKQIFAYPNLMPEHGIVVTRFSKGNDWHYIISDDRLPRSQCTPHTHTPNVSAPSLDSPH